MRLSAEIRLFRAASGFTLPAVALFALASSLHATTWYVATTGSDSNAGTSSAPFATIQKGVNVANPGDTISVADGTYGPNGHYTCGTVCSQNGYSAAVNVNKSGTAAAPITITAQNKWGAILNCNLPYGYSGDGTDGVQACDAYFNFQGSASYITIREFAITGAYWVGAMVNSNNSHISFIGNHFYNIGNRHYVIPSGVTSWGIVGVYAGTGSSYITWEGNEFNNIGRLPTAGQSATDYNHDHGLYVYNGPYTITNNIFYGQAAGWNIQTAPGAHDMQIVNNTMIGGANPSRDGCMILWGNSTNTTIQNNIFYNGTTYAIETYQASLAGTLIANNITYGTPSGLIDSYSGSISEAANLMNQNPLFLNSSANDYHLQAASPAIDAGASVNVATDFDGNPRPFGPAFDIGAYEYTGSNTAPVPSTPTASSVTGTAPPAPAALSVSPSSINFGSVATGTSSAIKLVTVTNGGSSAATITNATLGNSMFAWGGTGTCFLGQTLATGSSCTISLVYRPTVSGTQSGALTVTHAGSSSPQTVSLSGSANSPVTFSVSPSSVNFGTVAVGTSSAVKLVTLTNAGSAAVTITNAALANSAFAWGGVGTCYLGQSLATGSSCTISLVFRPTTNATQTGSLTVTDTGTGSPQTVALSGQ